jgi:hypothetical protein
MALLAAIAAFVANCLTEALPPINYFAVCFILAIIKVLFFNNGCQDDVMMNVDVSFFHCILLCQ